VSRATTKLTSIGTKDATKTETDKISNMTRQNKVSKQEASQPQKLAERTEPVTYRNVRSENKSDDLTLVNK
jgi:hypothetical protein